MNPNVSAPTFKIYVTRFTWKRCVTVATATCRFFLLCFMIKYNNNVSFVVTKRQNFSRALTVKCPGWRWVTHVDVTRALKMAESEEEVDVLVQRVVKDINNAFKRNPNMYVSELALLFITRSSSLMIKAAWTLALSRRENIVQQQCNLRRQTVAG